MRRVLLHAIDDGKEGVGEVEVEGGRVFKVDLLRRRWREAKRWGQKLKKEEEATFFRCCLSLPRRLEIGGGGAGGGRPLWNLSEELG